MTDAVAGGRFQPVPTSSSDVRNTEEFSMKPPSFRQLNMAAKCKVVALVVAGVAAITVGALIEAGTLLAGSPVGGPLIAGGCAMLLQARNTLNTAKLEHVQKAIVHHLQIMHGQATFIHKTETQIDEMLEPLNEPETPNLYKSQPKASGMGGDVLSFV